MKFFETRNGRRLFVLALVAALAAVVSPMAAVGAGKRKGRMTGGGSVFTSSGVRVTHGFELRCRRSDPRQNLEINWEGNRFHLTRLREVVCRDDPAIDQRPPRAPLDTYEGFGSGRYNGQSGATARWRFVDAGEPGTRDTARIEVFDRAGNLVLFVEGPLTFGNHQAHASNN